MNIFKVDTIENTGDNWLIADLGCDEDGSHYIITTNYIRASELWKLGTVKEQADLICLLLNEYYKSHKIKVRTSPLGLSELVIFAQNKNAL